MVPANSAPCSNIYNSLCYREVISLLSRISWYQWCYSGPGLPRPPLLLPHLRERRRRHPHGQRRGELKLGEHQQVTRAAWSLLELVRAASGANQGQTAGGCCWDAGKSGTKPDHDHWVATGGNIGLITSLSGRRGGLLGDSVQRNELILLVYLFLQPLTTTVHFNVIFPSSLSRYIFIHSCP